MMTSHRWFRMFSSSIALLVAVGIGTNGSAEPVDSGTTNGFHAKEELYENDPWEPFNEKNFWFNRQFDRFLLKPFETGYDWALPDPLQTSVGNALDNLNVVRRFTNNIFQLKFSGAGRELARFTINSTLGFAGLFDVAKDGFGIEQADEDAGQTLGYYDVNSGPYLVLPFLPVTTVRDGIGELADTLMNPLYYFLPMGATLGLSTAQTVNGRSLNLDKFEQVEESVIDLYGGVRNAYFQRREAAIEE